EQAAAVDLEVLPVPHEPELDGEPEEPGQCLHDAGEPPDPLRFTPDLRDDLDRGVGAIAESDQGVRKGPISMHRHMAGNVVEYVRLGEVIERPRVPDGDGGGKFPITEAVEEQKRRNVSADGLC